MSELEKKGQAIAREVDDLLDKWRAKTVSIVLIVACLAALPALIAVLSGRIFHLAWPIRALCGLLYLPVALAAVRPHWKHRLRAAVLLGVLAVFGVVQLSVTQLAGDGKISLLILPLSAVIFVGPRTGWWMVALSALLFVAVALLTCGQMLTGLAGVEGIAARPMFWILQGMRLAAHMVVLTILLTKFYALQRHSMIAERIALRKLEAETADRKRLEREVAHISEVERRNLGAELHDGLCQNLTAALLNCTALENRHAASGVADGAQLARIREEIEASIDTAYEVARGLCPVDLQTNGLIPALENLCRTARERRGLACEYRADSQITIVDSGRALQLYRIASEALTNAVKHAECSRVVVRLVRHSGEIELTVTDDGKGIPGDAGEGMGQRIMAYRASLIGGSLTVTGTPDKGTTVTCRVPCPEGEA